MAEPITNFSAGPSALPTPVRAALAEALKPSSIPSIAEISHRGARFGEVAEALEDHLRRLTGVGDSHHILLLHGGANLQFAQIPMNFAGAAAGGRAAGYLITGHWGQKAVQEAKRVGPARVIASTEAEGFVDTVEASEEPDLAEVAYVHYTGNETIQGVQYPLPPDSTLPRVADLSSEFLSRPYPYQDLALAYAGVQKNLGIAGLTVVMLSKAWIEAMGPEPPPGLPAFLDYRQWIRQDSMFNTPCTWAWFVALEMCRWIEGEGGLGEIAARNAAKAAALYAQLDGSDFYHNPVQPRARSVMNVPFWLSNENAALTPEFVAKAEAHGLLGLKGHRAVGGLRASLYNAIDLNAVHVLVDFMKEFERTHG